ncbi:MAG: RNA polymerase sigma factor [Planctomycetota bacterium]
MAPSATALASWLHAADRPLAPAEPRPRAIDDHVLLAHQDRLRRLVHRLLAWPLAGGDVEDLVQDVLLAAWRHRGTFRGEASVGTWLCRIAIRRVQRHARWVSLRRGLRPLLPTDEVRAEGPDGATATAATEEVSALRGAMTRLRHPDREILVLRYLEGRAIDEVAALLGTSRAAADQRLSRARARLRALLPFDAVADDAEDTR